jgi:hypothetical protein
MTLRTFGDQLLDCLAISAFFIGSLLVEHKRLLILLTGKIAPDWLVQL